MIRANDDILVAQAKQVLEQDRVGRFTKPAPNTAPVVVGLGLHRHGLCPLRPGARRGGAARALRRSVDQRAGAAYRVQPCGCRLLAEPRDVAHDRQPRVPPGN